MTSSTPFFTADVFTTEMFGRHQLAVVPAASGLDARPMQAIARELDLSARNPGRRSGRSGGQ
jgi:predicted PhzF superfamily epimerase YddE/YHI9